MTEPTATTEPATEPTAEQPAAGPAGSPAAPIRATELLAALRGLLKDPDLRMLWTGTVNRLITHRARLSALQHLRLAFTAPELADGPIRSDGRLRAAASAVHAEVTAQTYLWGHIAEEMLARVVEDVPPANSSALLRIEAMPPWETPARMQAPACSVPLPEDERPPLIAQAMDRLADIEQVRRDYLDAYGCACDDRDCPDGAHVPEAERIRARVLREKIEQFPHAVLAYGDAVVFTLTRELRSNLLRHR